MQRFRPHRRFLPNITGTLFNILMAFGFALLNVSPVWAVPLTIKLTPQNANFCSSNSPCIQPTVDGFVPPMEYADGHQFPLQDYAHGGPNGTLFLAVSDVPAYTPEICNSDPPNSVSVPWLQTNPCQAETLFVGLRLARAKDSQGNFLDASGQVEIWLDAKRANTLKGVPGSAHPQSEDQKLVLAYNTGPNGITTIRQYVGNGQGWTVPNGLFATWPVTQKVTVPGSDPANVHIELAILLRPFMPKTSEPLQSHSLGFGLRASPGRTSAGLGTVSGGGILPNDKSMPPLDTSTLSWMTLDFSAPTPIPMSFTMWNVGQMPYTIHNGGSGDASAIAMQIFNKETVCLSEVWTSAERQDIAHKVNALRTVSNLPPMNVIDEANDDVLHPAVQYTGLLLLTSHEILLQGIHHFPHELCTGSDCLQDKGVMWARLALPSAHKAQEPGSGPPMSAQGLDGSEFMDVFCTHVNAGDYQPGQDTSIRESQFRDVRAYMDQVRKGGPLNTPPDFPYLLVDGDVRPEGTWTPGDDRPAVLLSDMNTPGPRGPGDVMGPYPDPQQYTT